MPGNEPPPDLDLDLDRDLRLVSIDEGAERVEPGPSPQLAKVKQRQWCCCFSAGSVDDEPRAPLTMTWLEFQQNHDEALWDEFIEFAKPTYREDSATFFKMLAQLHALEAADPKNPVAIKTKIDEIWGTYVDIRKQGVNAPAKFKLDRSQYTCHKSFEKLAFEAGRSYDVAAGAGAVHFFETFKQSRNGTTSV